MRESEVVCAEMDNKTPTPPIADVEKQMRPRPPGRTRLFVMSSIIVGILAGVPVWWKTTEVYRAPLPFAAVQSHVANEAQRPLSLPRHLHVLLLTTTTNHMSSSPDTDYADVEGLAATMWQRAHNLLQGRGGLGGGGLLSTQVTTLSPAHCSASRAHAKSVDGRALTMEELDAIHRGSEAMEQRLCSLIDLEPSLEDDSLDEWLEARLRGGGNEGGGRYTIVVFQDRPGEKNDKIVVGKYRHAWIRTRLEGSRGGGEGVKEGLVLSAARVAVEYFELGGWGALSGGVVEDGRGLEGGGGGQEGLPLGADGRAVMSFSLLNAAPGRGWMFDWDFASAEARFVAPVVRALAPVADLTVESQVLYYAPTEVSPDWDEALRSYIVRAEDLPFFTSSKQWHLDTSVAAAGRTKLLHFAVYVPPRTECPLRLLDSGGAPLAANGFTVPSWGGVVVWNPPNCSTTGGERLHGGGPLSGEAEKFRRLTAEDLQPVFATVVAQLRVILGLPPTPVSFPHHEMVVLPASVTGFAAWETDWLLRRRVAEDGVATASTLSSLSSLVQSLTNMVITDVIGDQVEAALAAANAANTSAVIGAYDLTAAAARKARANADEAFFHPSIMSLLYFPTEHHLAIYTPFFVPILLHAFLAFAKEARRYRVESKKYAMYLSSLASS